MAAHESPCTTTLYDRTGDETTFDEIERISISTGLNVPEAPAIDRDWEGRPGAMRTHDDAFHALGAKNHHGSTIALLAARIGFPGALR